MKTLGGGDTVQARATTEYLELINKYAPNEWIELNELVSVHGRKSSKSDWFLKKFGELANDINWKCITGQFADVKKVAERFSYKPPNGIDKFKEDTKYGCYLWVNEVISK